jgi:[ribosomal protein S5]-alanine N-acetyltransferase
VTKIGLISIDAEVVQALDRGPAFFEARYHARVGEVANLALEVAKQTMTMLESSPREIIWGGYLAADEDTASVIGCCGFKGAPTPEGTVEVAYFTFPGFEGRGYATAMAESLVQLAISSASVRRIRAHTLPERNASARILEKIGMLFVGEVTDPVDGNVWRWELESLDLSGEAKQKRWDLGRRAV